MRQSGGNSTRAAVKETCPLDSEEQPLERLPLAGFARKRLGSLRFRSCQLILITSEYT